MSTLRFWKTETIGNDFVLVHPDEYSGDLGELAIRLCDRRFSIGGDGLLGVRRGGPGEPDIVLEMHNADGSPDFCGNGLRCAALHAVQQGWEEGSFKILQHGVVSDVSVSQEGIARATMPAASWAPDDVPHTRTSAEMIVEGVKGAALSTGSAHLVAFVDDLPEDEQFLDVSPRIETHADFPEKISIMWTKIESEDQVRLRIWERGVGETLGCGTGAAAAAVEHMRQRGTGGSVEVASKGGSLLIEADSHDAPITATSKPTVPYCGSVQV